MVNVMIANRIVRTKIFNSLLVMIGCVYVLDASIAIAQDVHAAARVDSNNILIGDWLKLQVEVKHPENVLIQFPAIADSLQGFEILRRDSVSLNKAEHNV